MSDKRLFILLIRCMYGAFFFLAKERDSLDNLH